MSNKPIILPSRPKLWAMRAAALTALGVAGFLLYTHYALQSAMHHETVPFCSGASWLDCDTVLRGRWAYWFGEMPIALPAAMVWALVLGLLAALSKKISEQNLQRCGAWFQGLAVVIAGAAIWFIAIQAALGKWCSWCLVEHAIGLLMAGPLLLHGRRLTTRIHYKALLYAVIALVLLVVGQVIFEPASVRRDLVPRSTWNEPDASITLLGGKVRLNPDKRPILGGRLENGVALYVFDYTCHNCLAASQALPVALTRLGDKAPAVIAVLCPLNRDCNPKIVETLEPYRHACDIARLAAAVWLAYPQHFPAYHQWLFEHQKNLTPDKAKLGMGSDGGKGPIDPDRLAAVDKQSQQYMEQDVALSGVLGVTGLPALVLDGQIITLSPSTDSDELAELLTGTARP